MPVTGAVLQKALHWQAMPACAKRSCASRYGTLAQHTVKRIAVRAIQYCTGRHVSQPNVACEHDDGTVRCARSRNRLIMPSDSDTFD